MKHTKSLFLIILFALAACSPAEDPVTEPTAEIPIAASATSAEVPAPVETSTQVPTSVPTLLPTNTSTASASPTLAPTELPQVEVIPLFTYVRSGPGEMYEIVATATQGLVLDIEGRSWAGNWLATPLPWGEQGWVFVPDVTAILNMSAVPVIVVAEPTAEPFYSITVSNRTGGELHISIFEIGLRKTYISSSPKSFTLQGGTYTFTVKVLFGGPPCIMKVTVDSDVFWEPTSDNLCPPYRSGL